MSIKKSILLVSLLVPFLVSAQNQSALPRAGLTPESSFYFLDRLGEALQEFFTFNPEGKARLQISFAAERIAEIKVILETKGIQARGLTVAQSRLEANLARAAEILDTEKTKGKDVAKLAKELDEEFEGPKTALKEIFKDKKQALENQEQELKAKIREARRAGDAAQAGTLTGQLDDIKGQKELLEQEKDKQEEALEKGEERIEEEMEAKVEAEKAIQEAEKEKQEVLDEAAAEDLTIPAEAFEKFERLLNQAKELFSRENYQGAKQLAKQAEKSLEKVKAALEDLESAKEKEKELKEEKAQAVQNETGRLEGEGKKAQEETKKAEERLREAGKEEED